MSEADDWNDLDDYLLGMGVGIEDDDSLCHSSIGLDSSPVPIDMFNEDTDYPQDDYGLVQNHLSLHNYAYFILKGSDTDKSSNPNSSKIGTVVNKVVDCVTSLLRSHPELNAQSKFSSLNISTRILPLIGILPDANLDARYVHVPSLDDQPLQSLVNVFGQQLVIAWALARFYTLVNDIPEGHALWTPPSIGKYSAWKDSFCVDPPHVENVQGDPSTGIDDTVLEYNEVTDHTSDDEEDKKTNSLGNSGAGCDANSLVHDTSSTVHPRRTPSPEPVPVNLNSGLKSQSVIDSALGPDGDDQDRATLVDMPPQEAVASIPKRQQENFVSSPPTSATSEVITMPSSPLRSSSSHNIAKPDRPKESKKRKTTQMPPKVTKRAKKKTAEDPSTSEAMGQDPVFGPRNIFLPTDDPRHKDRRFPCPLDNCTHRCKYSGDLARHLKCKYHAEPSEVCPKCNTAFTRQDSLKRHHKDKPDCDIPPSS